MGEKSGGSVMICKWNVLGIQGALLLKFIDPIYLKSITIGSNFEELHLRRALADRVASITGLPEGFQLANPQIGQSSVASNACALPETYHTSEHCLAWSAGHSAAEQFQSSTGQTVDNQEVFICKRNLLRYYTELSKTLRIPMIVDESGEFTYNDAKLYACQRYNDAKEILYRIFEHLGFGPWLRIYPEVDIFTAT